MLITTIYYLFVLFCFENIVVQGLRYKENTEKTVELLDIEILHHDKSLPKETKLSDVLSDHNVNDMTGEKNENNTKNEGMSNKVITVPETSIKPISETNSINHTGTETQPIIDETTLSDLTTEDDSEKISIIIASSLETSSMSFNTLTSISDSTSMEPLSEEIDKMSSGIIAVVMAIIFAVIVIIVYIGLLIWRRYLEYQYGNRELLVNDLEFDTNDLRHFEL